MKRHANNHDSPSPGPMTLRMLVLIIVFGVGVLVALLMLVYGYHLGTVNREGIDSEFSEMQPLPSVRVNASAVAAIRHDAEPQRRYPESEGDWPGFRGSNRISRIESVRIAEDWETNPPRAIWRRSVGEAWSSIAIVGQRIYTQEQRGESEVVACYELGTGNEIWAHRDRVRLPDSESRTGPRATPACEAGKVVTMGSTGILNCFDGVTGELIWSIDLVQECDAQLSPDGMCCSPLVVDQKVIVIVTGCADGSTCAVDLETGRFSWRAGKAFKTFSSPQWAEFDGQEQVLVASDVGVESFAPRTGQRLWVHESTAMAATRMLQPAALDDNSFLFATGQGTGIARIAVARSAAGVWQTAVVWESDEFQPYLSDFTIHHGCVYGIEEPHHCCLDLYTGTRRWKQGRYAGQALLFSDADQRLIFAGDGRLVLQSLDRDGFIQRASIQAIEGTCYGHPAYRDGRLVLRNREQMACFELKLQN